nr:hypothetical protein B296_00050662 [Ipomoea batatas]GMC54255.1 hypothetical protein B296_00050662 [Ipomoea batatas]
MVSPPMRIKAVPVPADRYTVGKRASQTPNLSPEKRNLVRCPTSSKYPFMFINTLFIGVPIGLKNRGEMNEVGVHDFPSFDAPVDVCPLGDLCPDGVSISGVDARGVAGIDISSVSGLSSIKKAEPFFHPFCLLFNFFTFLFVSSDDICFLVATPLLSSFLGRSENISD